MDMCPVCGQTMTDDSAIGPSCINNSCPVTDDALLWYKDSEGRWKHQQWLEGREYELADGSIVKTLYLSPKE